MAAIEAGDDMTRVLPHLGPGHGGDGVTETEHGHLPRHPPHPGPLRDCASAIEGPVDLRIVN